MLAQRIISIFSKKVVPAQKLNHTLLLSVQSVEYILHFTSAYLHKERLLSVKKRNVYLCFKVKKINI